MENEFQKDTILSHSILNYLFSVYQGEYSATNTRILLSVPGLEATALKDLEPTMEKIHGWYTGLANGDCLFSANWKKPETFDAKKALEFAKQIKKSLTQEAVNVKSALANIDSDRSLKNVSALIAGLIRSSTSATYYNKGFLDLADLIKKEDLAKRYELPVQIATQENELAHKFLSVAKGVTDENYSNDLISALKLACQKIPGVLRAQAHDLNQILSQYEAKFTFALAEFTPAEAEIWQAANINPQAAGYWRSYDFSPEEAIEWDKHEIGSPAVAALWHLSNFTPKEAQAWSKDGFAPITARRWADAGYAINEALSYVNRGILDPDNLPKGT